MAKSKKATDLGADKIGPKLRSASADDAGGADDAATGAQLAVDILVGELRRIKQVGGPLDPETGNLVAHYARTLSGIEQARRKGGAGDEMRSKKDEELFEMVLQDPVLRDALRRHQR